MRIETDIQKKRLITILELYTLPAGVILDFVTYHETLSLEGGSNEDLVIHCQLVVMAISGFEYARMMAVRQALARPRMQMRIQC